jgi:hypothetical protein
LSLNIIPYPTASGMARAIAASAGGLALQVKYIAVGSGLQPIVLDAAGRAETDTLKSLVGYVEVIHAEQVNPYQWQLAVDLVGIRETEWNFAEFALCDADKQIIAIYGSATQALMTISPALDNALLAVNLVLGTFPANSITIEHHNIPLSLFQDDLEAAIYNLQRDALTKALADLARNEHLTALDERVAADERNLTETAKQLGLQVGNAAKQLGLQVGNAAKAAQTALDEQAKQFLQLLAWEQHTQAMYRRARGHSGLMAIRQYTYHGDLRGTASSEKGTPGHMHQHPEWGDLVGTGEVWGVINGWTFKARHRDHRMERPADAGSAWLATTKLLPPPLPTEITRETTVAGQTTAMAELFRRYNVGEFPVGFRADLTALEVWFEPYSSTIEDTFHSPRHTLQTNSMTDALRLMMHYAHSGLKDRFENQSVEMPLVAWVDADGNPQLGILRYRMVCTALTSMGDVRQYLEPVEDLTFDEGGWGHSSQRYRVMDGANAPGALDTMMSLLPGLDGAGASLTETHTRYGVAESIRTWADSNKPLNAAYYNRFAQALDDDAANRQDFIRSDYDPYLFVASNTRTEVLPMALGATTYHWSWAIPMEIVIRTPLESWNPHNVPTVADSGNYATAGTQANPFRGLNPDAGAYIMTPAELYSGASNAEVADTATGEYWVMCGDGAVRKMRASGIWMQTPPIIGAGSATTRYAIHPEHQEGDKPYAFAMGAYRQTAGVSMHLMSEILKQQLETV